MLPAAKEHAALNTPNDITTDVFTDTVKITKDKTMITIVIM